MSTRIAVPGAGVAAPPHLRSLHDLAGRVELAWVWSRDLARLAAAELPAGALLVERPDAPPPLVGTPQASGAGASLWPSTMPATAG